MREPDRVGAQDSLQRVANVLRESTFGSVIAMGESGPVGTISESSLLSAFANGCSMTDPAERALEPLRDQISINATGAEALRLFSDRNISELLVVDASGKPIGILSPADVLPKPEPPVHPGLVGGMATPFGVYLTNGAIRAGASDLALVTTGMLLFTLFFAADALTAWVFEFLPANLPQWLADGIGYGLPTVLFLASIRLMPLSGIHAAEHKVVHAIEHGEPLISEVVGRMPRVHPRCGTNLAAGLALFIGISSLEFLGGQDVRTLLAFLVTLFFWRPLGNLMQYFVTTKPPNAKQLEMGLRAGRDLMTKFQASRQTTVSPFQRIWASGMLHVIAGSTICFGILSLLAWALKLPVEL